MNFKDDALKECKDFLEYHGKEIDKKEKISISSLTLMALLYEYAETLISKGQKCEKRKSQIDYMEEAYLFATDTFNSKKRKRKSIE